MRLVMIALYVLLILVGITFAILNAGFVKINLYVTTWQMPISVLMTFMFGIGLISGFLLFINKYLRIKINHLKLKNQLKLTEKEIKNLRNIPLKDQH